MKTLVVSCLIILSALSSKAGFGLSDWECDTPGGNRIGDPGSGIIFSFETDKTPRGYQDLDIIRWYFYKSHVIGEATTDGQNTSRFFAVDEETGDFKLFNKRTDWEHYLNQKALKPKIWTRWYSNNWVFFGTEFLFYCFALFFISVPLLIFLLWGVPQSTSRGEI